MTKSFAEGRGLLMGCLLQQPPVGWPAGKCWELLLARFVSVDSVRVSPGKAHTFANYNMNANTAAEALRQLDSKVWPSVSGAPAFLFQDVRIWVTATCKGDVHMLVRGRVHILRERDPLLGAAWGMLGFTKAFSVEGSLLPEPLTRQEN